MDRTITKLKKFINSSDNIVAFTGAGFSADSGISTFRGKDGLWSKYDPSVYASIDYFKKDPIYYWTLFKDERYPVLKNAKPNKGHYALVELEKQGKLYRIITQNIDGLHQIAGSSNVIELHGNTRIVNCLRCGRTYSMEEAYKLLQKQMPPVCKCGGKLKPGTVLFGEPLPQCPLDRAMVSSKNCDMFIVLGSSLVVYPATSLPLIAKRNNAKLVIINIDPTPLDHVADFVVHENTSKLLPSLVDMG